jgi:hypothetical protein
MIKNSPVVNSNEATMPITTVIKVEPLPFS